jgi:hypothetical protein
MFIKLINGVPQEYTINQLKTDNSNIFFPLIIPSELLAEYNVYEVVDITKPVNTFTESYDNYEIVLIDNIWVQQWVPRAPTESEINVQKIKLINYFANETQKRLDLFAKSRNYESMLSLTTYIMSTNLEFQAEAQFALGLRDTVWTTLFQILDDIKLGNRPIPTSYDEIFVELPIFQWPE